MLHLHVKGIRREINIIESVVVAEMVFVQLSSYNLTEIWVLVYVRRVYVVGILGLILSGIAREVLHVIE